MASIQRGMSVRGIAREIGMSPMTVSRVLNGGGKVKAETRDMIFSLIEEKGYKISTEASLSHNSQAHVLVNTSNIFIREDSDFLFYSLIWFSLAQKLKDMDITCELADLGLSGNISVRKIMAGGLAVFMKQLDDSVFDSIRKFNRDMKFLTIGFRKDGMGSIRPDEFEGGRLAALHFHMHGHSHVGVFTQLDEDSFKMRFQSFVSTFKSLNPDSVIELIRFSEPSLLEPKDGPQNKALEEFFSSYKPKPTGIFCLNGYATMVLYKFLRRRGSSIPGDIGVLGYDNPEFYELIDTPLSRIAFPVGEIGGLAANLIYDMLLKKCEQAEDVLVPVKLIERDSVIDLSKMNIGSGGL